MVSLQRGGKGPCSWGAWEPQGLRSWKQKRGLGGGLEDCGDSLAVGSAEAEDHWPHLSLFPSYLVSETHASVDSLWLCLSRAL